MGKIFVKVGDQMSRNNSNWCNWDNNNYNNTIMKWKKENDNKIS